MRVRVFFLLILSVISFAAGEVQFDLGSYEPIAYRTIGFDFTPGLGHAMTYGDVGSNQLTMLNPSGTISFFINKEDSSRQTHLILFNNTSMSLLYSTEESHTTKSTYSFNNIFQFNHRKYTGKKNRFVDFYLGGNMLIADPRPDFPNYPDYSDYVGYGELNLSAGKNRIKEVTYPAVTLHFFNYLQKRSKLSQQTKEIVQETAEKMEYLQRARVLDRREKRISDMKKITQFMADKGITNDLSVEETIRLLDYWEYGFNQRRYAGKEFSMSMNIFAGDTLLYYVPYAVYDYTKTGILSILANFKHASSPSLKRSHMIETSFGVHMNEGVLGIPLKFKPLVNFYPSIRSTISLYTDFNLTFNIADFQYHYFGSDLDMFFLQNNIGFSVEYFLTPSFSYKGGAEFIQMAEDSGFAGMHSIHLGCALHL